MSIYAKVLLYESSSRGVLILCRSFGWHVIRSVQRTTVCVSATRASMTIIKCGLPLYFFFVRTAPYNHRTPLVPCFRCTPLICPLGEYCSFIPHIADNDRYDDYKYDNTTYYGIFMSMI